MSKNTREFNAYYSGLLDAITTYEMAGSGLANLDQFNVAEIKEFVSENPSYANDIQHLIDASEGVTE